MDTQSTNNPKKPKTTYIFLGVGLGLLALGGLGYWYFKGRKGNEVDPDTDLFHQINNNAADTATDTPDTKPTMPTTKNENSGFPLKRGSTGALVKQLQTALNQKYGESVFAAKDIIGIFGPKTEAALISKGFPKVIDLTTFTKIITPQAANPDKPQVPGSQPTTNPDTPATNTAELSTSQAVDIANNLQKYAAQKDLFAILTELKRLRTVNDYVNVNTVFKNIRLNNVHQTIVTGLLSVFSDAGVKPLIVAEFKRMGLKQSNTGTWSLSGLGNSRQIITRQATTIRANNGFSIDVPEETMLGVEIGRVRHYSRFRTLDNNILYVPLNHIRYV